MVAEIEGRKYYPLYQFADMTCRSISTIRHLMFTGNRIRKLEYKEEKHGIYYIPIEEYINFPFTSSGRFANNKVYHYTADGIYVRYTENQLIEIYKSVGKEYIPRRNKHGKAYNPINS